MMRMPPVKPEFFALVGGLDLKTTRILLKPGRCRVASNYLGVLGGGYRRIGGYERYDGRSKPSYQTYEIIYAATTFTGGGLAVGSTVNGATSGATGVVIEIGTGSKYLAVVRVTGTFTTTENIRIGVTVIGAASATVSVVLNSFDNNRLQALVEANYRASILVVPGEGNVLGVAELKGVVYAIRNNVGSTAAKIFKETTGGWVEVVPGWVLDFNSGGTTPIVEGSVLDNGGAVSATVQRVVVQSGSWGGGDATGYLVLSALAGGNWAIADPIEIGATNVGTATSITSAITLAPSGRYEFVLYNFTGSTDTLRLYGADGVNKAFEFDGTVYAPIRTGMTTDTPKHVHCHKNRLFLSFRGSAQHSSILSPFNWSPIVGAAEIAVGDDITGFASVPAGDNSGALMIFAKDRIKILYGSSVSDWNQMDYADKMGAAHYSVQKAGNQPIFIDELGISTAKQAFEYGGFKAAAISDHVDSLVNGQAEHVVASVASRLLSIYYLFFDDTTGVAVTFGARGIEAIMPFDLPVQVKCCWETNRNGGEMFVGGADGFVYQLERGRSFDGTTVEAYIGLAFNHSGGPTTHKSYVRATTEIKTDSACTISMVQQLSYDDPRISSSSPRTFDIDAASGVWDISTWDACVYDGQENASQTISLRGGGINIALNYYSESANELPHEFQGVVLHYIDRRLSRGR